MAQFTGTGQLTLQGTDSRIYDIQIFNTGGLVSNGAGARIENCDISATAGIDVNGARSRVAFCNVTSFENVGINIDSNDCVIEGNYVNMQDVSEAAAKGILINTGQRNRVIGNSVFAGSTGEACIEGGGNYQTIVGNTVRPQGGVIGILNEGGDGEIVGNTVLHASAAATGSGGAGIQLGAFALGVTVANNYIVDSLVGIASLGSTGQQCMIEGNFIYNVRRHGIHLNAVTGHVVTNNQIFDPSQATANTYDGILLEADCDNNTLFGNVIEAAGNTPRYGINIADSTNDDNVYVGNRALGSFGTAPYNNAGTGTVNTWPAAGGGQGDNLL